MMKYEEFIEFCIRRHDIEVNQKYGKILPYSFHLKMVDAQATKFSYLIPVNIPIPKTPNGEFLSIESTLNKVSMGCYGHDLIEDTRLTFNDIKDMVGEEVAEIIFLCTENKGRNRAERKDDEFYNELKVNKLAVFVKLCDIIANTKMGLLENSTMLNRARKEYPKIKDHLYCDEYKDMFSYLEKIYALQ